MTHNRCFEREGERERERERNRVGATILTTFQINTFFLVFNVNI